MASSARRLQYAPSPLPVGLIVFGTAAGLALAGGGYAPVTWGVAGLGLLWVVAAAVLFAPRMNLSTLELVTLASFVGLLAWTGLSAVWSVDPEQSIRELQRGLVAVAGLTALLLAARTAAAVAVMAALAAACTLAAIVALVAWLSAGAELAAGISEPVGYANALGLLAAMGALLALGFATQAEQPAGRRLAGATLPLLMATVYLSGSRGALAALALGLVVAVAPCNRRSTAVVAIAAGAASALAAVVVASALVTSDAPASRTTASGGPPSSVSVAPRLRFWAVAWRSAADAPLHGNGAGGFARTWLERRPVPLSARNAHNLYLETLTELGIPGLVLLMTALGAPLAAAIRARGHPLLPAAAGAYLAFLAHAAIDADWEMPVLTLTALGCAGALLLLARPPGAGRRFAPSARAGALALVLALMAFSYAGLMGSAALDRSRDLARDGALAQARAEARLALRWAPWSAEAWRVLGEAAQARGDRRPARMYFSRGLAHDPRSWALWRDLARESRGAARRAAATRAAILNPLGRR